MILQSLLGEDRWDEAADAGWSLTSMPLSCWSLRSKLLDFEVLASTWTSADVTGEPELTTAFVMLVAGALDVTMGEWERSECVMGFSQAFTGGGGAGEASIEENVEIITFIKKLLFICLFLIYVFYYG